MSFPRKLVAIAVPVTDRPSLLPDEEVSFRHLVRHLAGYDRYLIAPKSATIPRFGNVSDTPLSTRMTRS